MSKKFNMLGTFLFMSTILLTACGQKIASPVGVQKLRVMATTNIVGDVVAQIGGDLIELGVLLPVGTDPHSFDPTPQDIARVSDAEVVFANGAGLERFLDPLVESSGAAEKVVRLSEGIELLDFAGDPDHHGGDPHIWTDPNNVTVWVHGIEQTLSELDPANAQTYATNAEKYQAELKDLDTWIREQVAQIPAENRRIVTDHLIFGYFAAQYGFTQAGTIIAGYSTLAEPAAQELAALENTINQTDVRAIFVGNTVNPSLAERIAEDTGVQLIYIYTGSLSQPGGDAGSYIDYMRYNTTAIVNALK